MVVGAKVCELTDGFLWFVCGSYVGILTCPLRGRGGPVDSMWDFWVAGLGSILG